MEQLVLLVCAVRLGNVHLYLNYSLSKEEKELFLTEIWKIGLKYTVTFIQRTQPF